MPVGVPHRCSGPDLLDKEVGLPAVVPGRCSSPDVQNQVDMPAIVPHRCPGPASQWCNDRRWSRRADNCGVAAVAVLREVRGHSKVQFMDTEVFMRTARGDATGAVV